MIVCVEIFEYLYFVQYLIILAYFFGSQVVENVCDVVPITFVERRLSDWTLIEPVLLSVINYCEQETDE